MESIIRSRRSISPSFGKSAAMRQYPGMTNITGRVSTILSVVSFRMGS